MRIVPITPKVMHPEALASVVAGANLADSAANRAGDFTVTGTYDVPPSPWGLLPARMYPDQNLNLREAGLWFTLQPTNTFIAAAANGAVTAAEIDVPAGYDFFVVALVGFALRPTTSNINVPSDRYKLLIRQQNLASPVTFDNTYLPLNALFGSGPRPAPLAMPLVMPGSSTWKIDIINNESFIVNVYLEYRGYRKKAFTGANP